MRRLATAMALVLLSASVSEARCLSALKLYSPVHGYVISYIQALSYVDQGLQRMAATAADGDDSVVRLTRLLTDVELAARDYECAATVFGSKARNPFPRPRDDIERTQARLADGLAGVAEGVFRLLATNARDFSGLTGQVLAGKIPQNELPIHMAKIGADTNETLSRLPVLATGIANILVDSKPDTTTGKMNALRVTARERDDLVAAIDRYFGERAKAEFAAGLPYIDSGSVILRRLLTQDGWRLRPEPTKTP